MTFEQPANLNRFVAEPVPVNWASRWKFIRIFLPLIVFTTICILETLCFGLWERDAFEISRLWPAFVIPGFLLLLLLGLNEINLRGQGKPARLEVLDKGISFRTDRRGFIPWSKVVAFWFEDIPGEPQLSKVTIEYFPERKGKIPRRVALVLNKRDQCPALLSELKLLQQQYNLRVETTSPLPPRRLPRHPVLGMSLSVAGVFFLLHGMPMLLVPLSNHDNQYHQSDSDENWSPKQKQKVVRFLKSHFPTKADLDRFLIETGSALTIFGLGLMFLGNAVQKQKLDDSTIQSSSSTTFTARSG